ncbi:MAG: flippase-like domain-containing protein [Deltaproteobacteria bacterium]|nr:flippase-like domain-containing protein [Deltaproteobacteria bacterium]
MPADLSQPQRPWKLAAKLAVSLGLLLYLLRRVDFAEIARFVGHLDLGRFAFAVALYVAGQVVSALKWRRLASAVGFGGSAASFVGYYFIGVFFNAFGFGTVGGDVVRALYLAGSGGRHALAVNTVVADRVSGLVVLLGVALVALGVLHHYELPAALYWGVIALSGALLGGWRVLPRLLPRVLRRDSRLRRLIEQDLAPYWDDYRLLAEVSLLSLCFHLSQVGVLVVLVSALGLAVPWSYCFILGPLVNILAAIPVSLNGLGVREGGYVFFLAHIGVSRESAIAFALAWFVVVMLSGLVGGAVYVAHGPAPRGRRR